MILSLKTTHLFNVVVVLLALLQACGTEKNSVDEQPGTTQTTVSSAATKNKSTEINMTEKEILVRNRSVTVLSLPNSKEFTVEINNKRATITQSDKNNKFSSVDMPYRHYSSIEEFVESLMDNHPDFREKK